MKENVAMKTNFLLKTWYLNVDQLNRNGKSYMLCQFCI